MPADVTVEVMLVAASTIKGATGPRSFARQLPQLAGIQELEVEILPADVDKPINLPPITALKVLLIRTDLPCSFKKFGETVVHALAAGDLHLEVGTLATLTALLFTGSGSPKASVYIAVAG